MIDGFAIVVSYLIAVLSLRTRQCRHRRLLNQRKDTAARRDVTTRSDASGTRHSSPQDYRQVAVGADSVVCDLLWCLVAAPPRPDDTTPPRPTRPNGAPSVNPSAHHHGSYHPVHQSVRRANGERPPRPSSEPCTSLITRRPWPLTKPSNGPPALARTPGNETAISASSGAWALIPY